MLWLWPNQSIERIFFGSYILDLNIETAVDVNKIVEQVSAAYPELKAVPFEVDGLMYFLHKGEEL